MHDDQCQDKDYEVSAFDLRLSLVSISYTQKKRTRVTSNYHKNLQTVFLSYFALLYLEAKIITIKKKKKVTQYWLITQNTVNICYSSSITVPFEVDEEIWFLSSWKAHSFYILNDHVSKITKKNLLWKFWKNVYYFS